MRSPVLAIVFLIVGLVLLVLGISAAESFSSEFSEFFTGTPSHKAIWLFLGGVVCLVIGAASWYRSSRHHPR